MRPQDIMTDFNERNISSDEGKIFDDLRGKFKDIYSLKTKSIDMYSDPSDEQHMMLKFTLYGDDNIEIEVALEIEVAKDNRRVIMTDIRESMNKKLNDIMTDFNEQNFIKGESRILDYLKEKFKDLYSMETNVIDMFHDESDDEYMAIKFTLQPREDENDEETKIGITLNINRDTNIIIMTSIIEEKAHGKS